MNTCGSCSFIRRVHAAYQPLPLRVGPSGRPWPHAVAWTAQRWSSVLAGALWLFFAAFFLHALPSHAAPAADPWRIDDLAVLLDKSGQENIASVSRPERAADFVPVPDGFSAGYTRAAHWLRFTLQAPPPDAQGRREVLLEIHPPYVDDLQIYLSPAQAGGPFDVRYGGDLRPQSVKEVPYRGFVYRVVFADEHPRTAYVRLQTTSSSVLIVKAWEPNQFLAKISGEYTLFGLLLGLVLTGILANIWHGLWRREAIYRRYIAYLLATLINLLGINGLAGEFLFPEAPFWANHIVSLGIILVVLFGVRFYALALDVAHAAPWMQWVYRIQFWLAIFSLPAPFLGFYAEAIQILLLFVLVVLLTGTWRSIQLWRQGHDNGKILLLAHLFGLSGNLSAIPALLGWLPGKFWLIYGFQLRSVGTLLVLQLMLAKHVRAMQAKLTQASVDIEIAKTIAQQERTERDQQRHFLSMLTHELKTPLFIIRLRLGAANPTPRMQAHAERAVEDIDAIVERCAMVSRIDEQAGKPQRVPCQINELLGEILTQQKATERVAVQLAEGVLATPVPTDPLLLRTILSNLVDNALKYSPPDSTVHINGALSPQADRNGIRIWVENTPAKAGMPDAAHAFEKYYRAPGAHQQSGSGLGLYITKALAGQLGGKIDYRPQTNRIIFELWLPL